MDLTSVPAKKKEKKTVVLVRLHKLRSRTFTAEDKKRKQLLNIFVEFDRFLSPDGNNRHFRFMYHD
jgi:hypothetical protein